MHGHKCKLIPNVHMLQQESEEQQPEEIEDAVQQEQVEAVE